jgi:glycoside/pentoside/hexuronide:cation symporter, GPH family
VRRAGVPPVEVNRETLGFFALCIGFAFPVFAILAYLFAPEAPDRSSASLPLLGGFRAMAANRPFLRLITAFLFNGFANGLPATLFLFFVSDRLKIADSAGLFLLIYFGFGLLGVPFWLWLAGRVDKPKAWALGMILACLGFISAPFLPEAAFAGFALVCVVTGFAVGADLTLPPSIQADVIELDTARTGEERSATYMAAWSLATKLALALAAGLSFPLLAASGYDPSKELRGEAGIALLAFFYAGLPILLKIVAIALVWTLPLDRETQAANARRIAERRAVSL